MSTPNPWKLEAAAEEGGLAGPVDFVVEGGRCRAQYFTLLSTQQHRDPKILQDIRAMPCQCRKHHPAVGIRSMIMSRLGSAPCAMHFAPGGGAVRYNNWSHLPCEVAEGLRAGTVYIIWANSLHSQATLDCPSAALVLELILSLLLRESR